ncbi:MAG: VOC family protein [Actinomycetota bacterium]|nr:VOC family protein [Actinomycetota bacterium]
MATNETAVTQLRLVVTVDDLDEAISFYRDALGLPVEASFEADGRRVVILDAGRATLELGDAGHAAYVDEVEVGRRVAGRIRVAFEVADAGPRTYRLAAAGATVIAPPIRTPWDSLNSRLDAPGGLQLTLFQALAPETMA